MATPIDENVEVRHTGDKKGRGLFSKTSFEKGEVIFEEKPLVSAQFSWNELYKYRACEFCMCPLETAEENSRRLTDNSSLILPFPQCCEVKPSEFVSCPNCQVTYCCASCQQKAWSTYHEVLCTRQSPPDPDHPLIRLQDRWRNIHYPPETSTILLVVKMVAMIKQASDKSDIIRRFSQFVNTTVNEDDQIVHKLLGKQFQEQLELLRSQTKDTIYEENVQQ
ncbi:SET and MYND domain-containing protein 5-like, partial [Gigantopelta aegis]|uniref:SET and MYND domain-containing protein 5-like n=1 Tax=Gigantopelta aegis TaxID=1735272 RepID=UPI001B88D623